MAQRVQIPILILTGFLGSGKTSLLAKWLRAPEFEGAMVVVNELGEVGLDDRLVQHSSEVPLLLENGCACCEAAEDLNATLERLFWQQLHRTIPKFKWLLIETTGIADPALLIGSLKGHDLIAERYRIGGVATTFDAKRGPAQLQAHAECRSQMRAADAIILTKTDIASDEEMAAARAAVRHIRGDAEILSSARSNVAADALIAAINRQPKQPGRHEHGHGHHNDDRHGHSHQHSDDYSTAFAALSAPLDWDELRPVLKAVLETYHADLLRLKGTARTGPAGAIEIIQAIAGEAMDRGALSDERSDSLHQVKPVNVGLTIIARGLAADAIAADLLRRLGVGAVAEPAGANEGTAAHG